jgi:predicted phage gp36 major capsid-like protein
MGLMMVMMVMMAVLATKPWRTFFGWRVIGGDIQVKEMDVCLERRLAHRYRRQ